jgi:hypothetical protein
MAAVLALTPASEARGRKSCGSSCSSSSYCVVGYKTEARTVVSYDWITVKEKVEVTEYEQVKVKEKVTQYQQKNEIVKKPYTYWTCELVTAEEDVIKVTYDRVETKKKGTKKVSKMIEEEVPHKYTVDKGHWTTQCYEQTYCKRGCTYTKTCSKKVWVPNVVVVESKVKVHKCILVEEPTEWTEVTYNRKETKVKEKVSRYQKIEKKGEHTYTVCKYEPVVVEVDVIKHNPKKVIKEVDVRKCVRVEKKVDVQVPIYGCVSSSSGCSK